MKQIHLKYLAITLMLLLFGCAEQRLNSGSIVDEAWDESLNQEAKEIAAAGRPYATPGRRECEGCGDDGTRFFNQRKPQIKTVQIWLESGKVLSARVKNYLDSIMPGSDGDSNLSVIQKLAGIWYGLDRKHEGAIVFTFDLAGRFTWERPDRATSGTFEIDHSVSPHRITLTAGDLPGGYATEFEFINDNAMILKGRYRDVVLFKKREA